MHVCVLSHVLTLCDPMDCSLPGSYVSGIFQARIRSRLPFPPPGIRSTWDHLGQAGLKAEEYQVYVRVTEMAFWKAAEPSILQIAGTEASERD